MATRSRATAAGFYFVMEANDADDVGREPPGFSEDAAGFGMGESEKLLFHDVESGGAARGSLEGGVAGFGKQRGIHENTQVVQKPGQIGLFGGVGADGMSQPLAHQSTGHGVPPEDAAVETPGKGLKEVGELRGENDFTDAPESQIDDRVVNAFNIWRRRPEPLAELAMLTHCAAMAWSLEMRAITSSKSVSTGGRPRQSIS